MNQEKYLEQCCVNYKARSKCREVIIPDKLRGASLSTQGCQSSIYSNNICRLEAPLKIIRPTEPGIWLFGFSEVQMRLFLRKLLLRFSFYLFVSSCCCCFFLRDNVWNLRHFKAPSKQNVQFPECPGTGSDLYKHILAQRQCLSDVDSPNTVSQALQKVMHVSSCVNSFSSSERVTGDHFAGIWFKEPVSNFWKNPCSHSHTHDSFDNG